MSGGGFFGPASRDCGELHIHCKGSSAAAGIALQEMQSGIGRMDRDQPVNQLARKPTSSFASPTHSAPRGVAVHNSGEADSSG